MLNKIMKGLGYVPFAALVEAETEIKLLKDALVKTSLEVSDRAKDVSDLRKAAEKARINYADAHELVARYQHRDRPHVFVEQEPKRLSLVLMRSAIDPAPVVIKQGVRNKANEAHYADLMKAANKLIGDAFEISTAGQPAPPLDKPNK